MGCIVNFCVKCGLEVAFRVGVRVIDQYRSALKPDSIKALNCTRDWLFGKKGYYVVAFSFITLIVLPLTINCMYSLTLERNLEELTENIVSLIINKDGEQTI